MRLQDLTKDHLEILENWEKQEVLDQIKRLQEVLESWDAFHELDFDDKEELWDICS